MREMLSPTSALVGVGLLNDVVLITDGRFSGGSTGAVIGHVSPEAADGGLIAVVENGDTIRFDLENRKLELLLPEEEIARRYEELKIKLKDLGEGSLGRYANYVQSGQTPGAVLEGLAWKKENQIKFYYKGTKGDWQRKRIWRV